MPRKAPKEVVEHRITLGDYERKELKEAIDAYNRDKWLENVPYMIISIGTVGAAAGIGLAAYALYQWLDLPSLKDKFSDWALDFGDTLAEWGIGPNFEARMIARIKTFDSEQEVLDYYNPIIADLQEKRRLVEASSALTFKNRLLSEIDRKIDIAQNAKTKALIETGFKTGEGKEARKYSYAVLLSQIVTKYQMNVGSPPAQSYIGGPGEKAREEYYALLNAHIDSEIAIINANRSQEGKPLLYYEPLNPPEISTNVDGLQFYKYLGRIYSTETE